VQTAVNFKKLMPVNFGNGHIPKNPGPSKGTK